MNLSVKNVPDDVVGRLRERAKSNHRSLQGELLAIVEGAVPERRLTPRELYELVKSTGLQTPSESVQIIREDRDSR